MKSVRQLSCVSQDAEPPDSTTISRKGTKVLEPIRRVRFTRAALRQVFVTVMLLENTPAVLSLGKLTLREFAHSYHWTSGQKPHLIKKGKKIHCETSNHVPLVFLINVSCSPSQETVNDTEILATRRSESASEDTSARGNSWQ